MRNRGGGLATGSRGHVPLRRCLGCRRQAPRAELVRFVAEVVDGGWRLVRDEGGVKEGRGAYVCPGDACLARARERGMFTRALRMRGREVQGDVGVSGH
ncbi:MAG: YlxR family protein [Actinobacteria bacterium]|nr:YlxR family protein [Actinomycetota bacterium]